ncbi:alpha/beta hydrolase [Bacillus sp. V2I10]|uniref:alpha/beta hydrolase n=1 Tax=Bacillus sp. V2I10 TaxID=3042276 RepID=UPI002787F46C|nr:alpha/beta fold hydrolase [Bacillus sp. V2I10]MDQ0861683.1 pimeloyl-ACP methyl ester carboxylesterase [Bacillus sp. V2I10]
MWIIVCSIFAVFLTILAVSCFFSSMITVPRKVAYEKTYLLGVESGEINTDIFESAQKEEWFIDSFHGYQIHGMWFPVSESKKAIIIAHGITWSLFGSFKYVEMFQKRGYHVLLCDHRFHGLSGGDHTSFGYYESDDLKAWVDCLHEKLGKDAFVGILGESLGAASALQYVKKDPRVAFCIADCAFSDLTELLKTRLRIDFKVKFYPLISWTSIVTKIRYGWGFEEIKPARDLEHTKTPILFIHGKEDHFIPMKMTLDMYHLKKGIKQLYLVPKAGHAQAFLTDPKGYERKVLEFIATIEKYKESAAEMI